MWQVEIVTLASILRKSRPRICLNEHLEHPEGVVVFQHACTMGWEGIAAGIALSIGTLSGLAQVKNPEASAVKREAEGTGCEAKMEDRA